MSRAEQRKTISARVDADVVKKLDKEIMKRQLEEQLEMDFSRSDVVRVAIHRIAQNPDQLIEIEEEAEELD
jgi:hypothetical protein